MQLKNIKESARSLKTIKRKLEKETPAFQGKQSAITVMEKVFLRQDPAGSLIVYTATEADRG